jgi:hypothetical protein
MRGHADLTAVPPEISVHRSLALDPLDAPHEPTALIIGPVAPAHRFHWILPSVLVRPRSGNGQHRFRRSFL